MTILELPPEIAAIRTATAIARTSSTRALRLRGEGAREAALWLLPSRLHLRDAQARQSLLLDESGRPIADVIVCADDEDYLLLVEGPGDVVAHVKANARGDVTIEDLSLDHDVIEVHGPWAWELVAEVLGPDLVALPYLNVFRIDEGLCVRAGRTGEFGYQLIVPRVDSERVLARFLDRREDFDLAEVSPESLSLSAFENWFFDAAHVPEGATPIELQLQWRLASDRDFLGRAALERRRAEHTRTQGLSQDRLAPDGPSVRAVRSRPAPPERALPSTQICVIGPAELAAGAPLMLGSRVVGEVTRAAFSHVRGEWIASALVVRELGHGGIDRFTVRDVPVRSVAPPLVDNRSLYVDPRRHSYRTRDEVRFGPLVRPGRDAMGTR